MADEPAMSSKAVSAAPASNAAILLRNGVAKGTLDFLDFAGRVAPAGLAVERYLEAKSVEIRVDCMVADSARRRSRGDIHPYLVGILHGLAERVPYLRRIDICHDIEQEQSPGRIQFRDRLQQFFARSPVSEPRQ